MLKNKRKDTTMILNKKQTKQFIKHTIHNPEQFIYDITVRNFINKNKNNIKYCEYRLSPSCLGVSAYIYSVFDTNGQNKIKCEIRDQQEPVISKEYKYCSLVIEKKSKTLYSELNTQLAKSAYEYMDKLYRTNNR